MTALGPYSRPKAVAALSGRTREGRFVRDSKRELIEHIGGHPSAAELVMVERAVMLMLRLKMMDDRFLNSGAQTEHDSRVYLAWSASLARLMKQIGLKAAAKRAPTLAEHKAARDAARAA